MGEVKAEGLIGTEEPQSIEQAIKAVTSTPVVKKASNLIREGMGTGGRKIKIEQNSGNLLTENLLNPFIQDILCDNQPSPATRYNAFSTNGDQEIDVNGFLIGKFCSELSPQGVWMNQVNAYDRILKFQKGLYGNGVDVKLVRAGSNLRVVSVRTMDTGLKLIEVFDSQLSMTPRFKQARANGTIADIPATEFYENYALIRSIIIQDGRSGRAVDLTTILPEDWEFKYTISVGSPAIDPSKKQAIVCEILQEDHLVGLLHELGHVFSLTIDPQTFMKADELRNKLVDLKFSEAIDAQTLNKMRETVANEERGASATALFLVRFLKTQGINLNLPTQRMMRFINGALSVYESFPGQGRHFVRESKRVDPHKFIEAAQKKGGLK